MSSTPLDPARPHDATRPDDAAQGHDSAAPHDPTRSRERLDPETAPGLDVPWVTDPGVPAPGLPQVPPSANSRRARTLALVGGILGIVGLVTVGAALVYQKVGGGGPQPESVMPASVIAFAKVDLNPSGGQKLDAIRFALKFPHAKDKVSEDSDLRQVVIKGLQDGGQLKGVDYARDIKPWLGDRVGFGLVPGAAAADKPIPVIALAVTDSGAANASLPRVAAALDGKCQLVSAYALCTESNAGLDAIVASARTASLEKSSHFAGDMAALGEDGFASAWADGGALTKLPGAMPPGLFGMDTGTASGKGGRYAVALRFDGPNLELAGHVSDASSSFVSGGAENSGVADLPQGTLAAIGVAGAGEQLRASWPRLEQQLTSTLGKQQFHDGLTQLESAIGISVPDDLEKALGSQFVVAFGGMGPDHSDPQVAIVTNGDRAVLTRFAHGLPGLGAAQITPRAAGSRTVLAISDSYSAKVATQSGLGGSASFTAAVPDASTSRITAYADIAGILAEFKDEIPADTARNLAPLSAFGVSVRGSGTSADFTVRLITK